MGAIWSALLVGGGLAGALFVWLLRNTGKKGDAEKEKDVSPGEAAAAGGDQGGRGGRSPGPSRRELVTKPGILPPRVSRAVLQRAFEFTQGGDKPIQSLPNGLFPSTSLLYAGRDSPSHLSFSPTSAH